MTEAQRRSSVRRLAGVASAAMAVGSVLALAGSTASAAPGSPGTPQAPITVYAEDFQNRSGPTPIVKLDQYTGASGQTYTADQPWLTGCNGWVAAANQPVADAAQTADCVSQTHWNSVQQASYALGAYAGAADPNANFAVSAMTAGDPGAGHVEFQTGSNIPFSGSNRFITFSVDVAALNCHANPPLLQFSLLNDSGAATPVGSVINGCSSPTTVNAPALGQNAARPVQVGTYNSNGAVLVNGSSIGVQLVNNQPSGTGNDHAFDNIRILDVTPQLDKSFSPASVTVGETSTLTFTITNTSELAAKNGWSFTDALPAGLTVASPAASTNCPSGAVTAPAGATSIQVSGNLNAGMASCTVTVNVTSSETGTYTNGPDNVSTVGLNPPGSTDVTFTDPAADLAVAKIAQSSVIQQGSEIVYTITVTNNGPNDSSGYTLRDPIPAGLTQVTVSSGCQIATGVVTCTGGPLPYGQTHTYTVTGIADGTVAYVANTAQVIGNDPDPNTDNNTSTEIIEVEVPLVGLAAGGVVALTALGGGAWYTRRRTSKQTTR
ncbi:DUF11 domain-containing protein [Saccharomonospora sp. NPDC046836]|uniref:DUF11 domain-containing protein n=1 Tax=Saccharomonospora sp. NPDC046836 TaxID=3156921 RepID=UPI0033EED7F4